MWVFDVYQSYSYSFLYCFVLHRTLHLPTHTFPTRRSADLCCLLDLRDSVFELVLLLFDLSDNSSDAGWIIDDARRRKERRTRPDLRESDGREGASHREGGYAQIGRAHV